MQLRLRLIPTYMKVQAVYKPISLFCACVCACVCANSGLRLVVATSPLDIHPPLRSSTPVTVNFSPRCSNEPLLPQCSTLSRMPVCVTVPAWCLAQWWFLRAIWTFSLCFCSAKGTSSLLWKQSTAVYKRMVSLHSVMYLYRCHYYYHRRRHRHHSFQPIHLSDCLRNYSQCFVVGLFPFYSTDIRGKHWSLQSQ